MKFLAVIGLMAAAQTVCGQDILVQKNGDELEVKVLKISKTEVEYKKWSNQEGPSYTLPKSDVFMIKYRNGEKDVFKEAENTPATPQAAEADATPQVSKAMAADNNQPLIASYNQRNHSYTGVKQKDKQAPCWLGSIGVTSSSILSSDDVEISFIPEKKSLPNLPYNYNGETVKGFYADRYRSYEFKFIIEITNKTDQAIYIDKANTFRIEADGSYYMYYNTQQITTNQGSGSGAGMNLGTVTNALGIGGVASTLAGGVNVGGGSQSSVSTTHTDQRIVAIPPRAKVQLSKDEAVPVKVSKISYDQYKMMSFSEDFTNLKSIPGLKQGEIKQYTESDSPMTKKYMLTYALDAEFKTIRQMDFSLFLKDVVGVVYTYSYNNLMEKIILNESPQTIIVGWVFKK